MSYDRKFVVEDLKSLQQKVTGLHAEKETLIAVLKIRKPEIYLIERRLIEVDKLIEHHLTQQEVFWP